MSYDYSIRFDGKSGIANIVSKYICSLDCNFNNINAVGFDKDDSIIFSLPYGDQGYCLSKELFLRIGGFPENVKYGEDLYFVLKTKRLGIPIINIPNYLITSSRKYLNDGWLITTLLHQWRLILILINYYFKKKL